MANRIFWGVFFLLIVNLGVSCEVPIEPTGAWVSSEGYQAWKRGDSEDIVARKVQVGPDQYLALTNSTFVDAVNDDKFLQVPGGKWRILRTAAVGPSKSVLELGSYTDKLASAVITMNFLTKDSFYFTVESMNDRFRSEFKQAFVEPGKEFVYVRCDRTHLP